MGRWGKKVDNSRAVAVRRGSVRKTHATAAPKGRRMKVGAKRKPAAAKKIHFKDRISGNDNEKLSYAVGRHKKVSPSFISKVKLAASVPNYYTFRGIQRSSAVSGQCAYVGMPLLYDTAAVLAINTQIAAAHINTTRFSIESCDMDCQCTNTTNMQVFARVYCCEAREDIPYAPNYAPLGELINGFADAGQAAGNVDLTMTAFQSPAFVQDWKITSVKRIKFNPGETKVLTLADKSPNNINITRWAVSGTQTIFAQRKRSRFLMLQHWGQVAGDTANLAHIGTAISTLDFVATLRYDYRWSQDNSINDIVSGVPTWGDGSAATITAPLLAPIAINDTTGVSNAEVVD